MEDASKRKKGHCGGAQTSLTAVEVSIFLRVYLSPTRPHEYKSRINRMAKLFINLPVTADFVKPSLLVDASAETCVNVLLAGVAAVECANEIIAESTNATLTAKLTAKHEGQIARIQKERDAETLRIQKERDAESLRVQKEIEKLQADANLAKTLRAEAENRLVDATTAARRQAQEDAEERIRKAMLDVQKAEEKAAEFQNQLMTAVIAEKIRAEELVNAERARSDKALEEKNRTIELLHGINTSSSQKGGVYEQKIKHCVLHAFGTADKFDMMEKKYESGDHIFEWGEYKVMVEDKDKKEIDAEDLRKAHRDFTSHSECDAMIFISARAHIPKHQRPGDIDIGIHDGRPVIYLGFFNKKENRIQYLQSLQPVLRTLIELTKKAADSTEVINEKLSDKLRSIRQHFVYNETIINELVNKAKAAERNIKTSLDEMMLTIVNVQSTFKNSLASVVNDEDTTSPVVEEAPVEPEPEPEPEPEQTALKVTAKRSVPKKKST